MFVLIIAFIVDKCDRSCRFCQLTRENVKIDEKKSPMGKMCFDV
jgi:hypothetical protein